MAARPPLATVPQPQNMPGVGLCDYCHQKPKFSNHNYCSKKCGQAAGSQTLNTNLCNYCQKKPKFQNFDYCGKTCASLASNTNVQQQSQPNRPQARNHTQARGTNTTTIDPMQVAKLVIQQIPQLQSFLKQPQPQPVYQQPVPIIPVQLQGPQNVQPPSQNSRVPVVSKSTSNNVSVNMNAVCRVPGCGKPVHVDPHGTSTSEYCSMAHRQEAVSSGLVEACIMCLDLPQCETDYFCGRVCREEALDKNMLIPRDD